MMDDDVQLYGEEEEGVAEPQRFEGLFEGEVEEEEKDPKADEVNQLVERQFNLGVHDLAQRGATSRVAGRILVGLSDTDQINWEDLSREMSTS